MTDRTPAFPASWLMLAKGLPVPDATPARCVVVPPSMPGGPFPPHAWVLLAPEDDPHESIRLAVARGAEGVVLAMPENGAALQKVDVILSAEEAVAGQLVGGLRIVALCGDHAAGVVNLAGFAGKSARLVALGGAGETLRQALAVESPLAEPIRQARGFLVLCAAQAGIAALAGAEGGLSAEAFEAACRRDRADGFRGKIVTTDTQAKIANAVFEAG